MINSKWHLEEITFLKELNRLLPFQASTKYVVFLLTFTDKLLIHARNVVIRKNQQHFKRSKTAGSWRVLGMMLALPFCTSLEQYY